MRPRLGTHLRVAALVGAACAAGPAAPPLAAQAARAPAVDGRRLSDALTAVAVRVAPSVVQVVATVAAPVTPWAADRVAWLPGAGPAGGAPAPRPAPRQNGSGFVVDTAGLVVTNAHVVRGATRVRVALPPGAAVRRDAPAAAAVPTWVDAEIVGMDAETDVALLRLPRPTRDAAALVPPPLPFAPAAAAPTAGQLVVVVGSPLGLQNSVSLGVVSAAARTLAPDAEIAYVQTDAPINPGSSGGPVVNLDGQVVGLSTFILSHAGGSEGLGFALPAPLVRTVLDELQAHGRVRRVHLGLHAQPITPSLAAGLGLAPHDGLLVSDVEPGGPAERAGIAIGDQLLRVDGRAVRAPWQLEATLLARAPDAPVRLAYARPDTGARAEREVTLTAPARTDGRDPLAGLAHAELHVVPQLGIVGVDVDAAHPAPAAGQAPDERAARGVLVAAATPLGGPEDSAFEPGDVIVWAAGRRVASLAELRGAVETLAPRDAVVAQVWRRGAMRFVAFTRE
jgi:serine protease Do